MAKASDSKTTAVLEIAPVRTGTVRLHVLGTTPLIYNAMSFKASQELLLPKGRKTQAERAENLKHVPIDEYRNSVYRHRGDDHPTRLMAPVGAFKGAAKTAALRSPGVRKTEIGQLLWIAERDIDVYGVPQLFMAIVRSADMNRTPDVRTRARVENWCCSITVQYVKPLLSDQQVVNLFSLAGVIAGIGDGRQEKGTFNFGQFELVNQDDARFAAIVKNGGRKAQDAALLKPETSDVESERLLEWYTTEVAKLGERSTAPKLKVAS